MKIKTFICYHEEVEKVNRFIQDKEVIDIKTSSVNQPQNFYADGRLNENIIYTVYTVMYKE